MEINDTVWIRLSCRVCETSEVLRVNDTGNPNWGSLGTFEAFDVESTGGGGREPEITSAACQKCSAFSTIETRYGLNRPEEF